MLLGRRVVVDDDEAGVDADFDIDVDDGADIEVDAAPEEDDKRGKG